MWHATVAPAPAPSHHGPVDAEFVRDCQQQVVLRLAPNDRTRHRGLRVCGAHRSVPGHGALPAAAADTAVRLPAQLLLALVGVLGGGEG